MKKQKRKSTIPTKNEVIEKAGQPFFNLLMTRSQPRQEHAEPPALDGYTSNDLPMSN